MNKLDRVGRFRVTPIDWSLHRAKSGAVGIRIIFKVLAMYDEEEGWQSWEDYEDYETEGTWWVVGKDQSINTMAMEQISGVLGWDGELESIVASNPPQVMCQTTVHIDEYKGRQRFRADWLNHYTARVESGGGMSEQDLGDVQSRFGSLLRAAAASAKKEAGNQAPESSKPKKKAPATPAATQSPPAPSEEKITVDEANARLKVLLKSDADDTQKAALLQLAKNSGLHWDKDEKQFTDLPF